jgi:RimJ/RimL family protein N-acetyltransferase
MERLGHSAWILGVRRKDAVVAASLALLRSGRLMRTLEIPSLCVGEECAQFWKGLTDFCRSQKITDLILNTFHSRPLTIPHLPGEIERRSRQEYLIDLTGDFSRLYSSDHRKNLKKARAANVTVRSLSDSSAIAEHIRLMEASGARRRNRGENVHLLLDSAEYQAYLATSAGEIYQAVHNQAVISSALVLRSAKGGYYHTSGTTPEGMRMGASRLLISSIADDLKERGATVFNLGGAEEGSTLADYKAGFGAGIVPLEAVRCYTGPVWKRKLRSAAALARGDRGTFLRALSGNIYSYVVYAADPAQIRPADVKEDLEIRPLSEIELQAIQDPEFRQKQLARSSERNASSAFGVFAGGELGHISWLVPAEIAMQEANGILRLDKADAEITGCETLPQFRGRGLYPFAIRQICALAAQQGVSRIYMKTHAGNRSSRAGIEKAGLTQVSRVVHITPPVFPSTRWTLRLPYFRGRLAGESSDPR